ncbi:DUF418 domain-containing protein [Marinimicrobium alkaliphilum]|uniref:DUF418 domain-containing protein n=1 Tax=Marinimicrobium alkaliphilum TaxID=2202654 RepID=UPI000DB9D297|nr:DUF418 domain-containing protein [Marinimicrobium alkaliphilum]
MNPTPPFQPTSPSRRMLHLDVLRGFALLGILLVNFQWFGRPLQAMWLGPDWDLSGADQLAELAIMTFAEGKFYPLFSLLFGAGFALLLGRAHDHGASGAGLYLRRMAVLALFGGAHILLLWPGDILLLYAVTGALMLWLFRRTPVQRQWKWGVAFLSVGPLLILILLLGVAASPDFAQELHQDMTENNAELHGVIERANAVFSDGTFAEAVRERVASYWFLVGSESVFWLLPVLGYFMLGRWLWTSGRLERPEAATGFLRAWAGPGLLLGLALMLVSLWLFQSAGDDLFGVRSLFGAVLFTIGSPVLALGYLALVTRKAGQLTWLAPVGRMALTHYLLQSLFWTSVFYGYGLGLWGQIPRAVHPVCVLVFFAGQVWLSHWWLRRYHFGPAEWLWRSLAYGQRPAMTKALGINKSSATRADRR